jgi:hypothetical protein
MSTIPSPLGSASFLVAYDLDGVLKQKDYQGIVSNITSPDSSKLDKGSYVGTAETLHNELLSLLPIGLRGQIIKIKNENTNQYESNELLLEGKFISNDTELEDAKINIITQEEIFNTWGRYSHGDATLTPTNAINSDLIPGTPLHTNSWFYNSSQSRIESTFNTGDIIGFVSNSLVKEYSQSATLGANNADNDRIGFCLFYEDLNDMVDNNAYGLNPGSFSWARYYFFKNTKSTYFKFFKK